jgi:hypothetical protein
MAKEDEVGHSQMVVLPSFFEMAGYRP